MVRIDRPTSYEYGGKSYLTMEEAQAARQAALNPAAAKNSGSARVDAARKKMYGLAEGRLGELKGDATDKYVADTLRQRAQGGGPYDATTRSALLTGAADQAAHLEQQQMERLQARGGNVNDPSFQAAQQEIQARRQQAGQAANLDINQKANVANYDAQGQTLGQLGGFNQMRNNAITDQGRYVSGLYQKEYATPESSGAGGGIPSYASYASGGGAARPQAAAETGPSYDEYFGKGAYAGARTAGLSSGPTTRRQQTTTPVVSTGPNGNYVQPQGNQHGYYRNSPATIQGELESIAKKPLKPFTAGGFNIGAFPYRA